MFRQFAVAVFLSVVASLFSFGFAFADEIFVGDAKIVAYYGNVPQAVGPDSDSNTGQLIVVQGNPTKVENQSEYWHAWAPGHNEYMVAWVNEH
jgi:hypothetical protein